MLFAYAATAAGLLFESAAAAPVTATVAALGEIVVDDETGELASANPSFLLSAFVVLFVVFLTVRLVRWATSGITDFDYEDEPCAGCGCGIERGYNKHWIEKTDDGEYESRGRLCWRCNNYGIGE